MKPEELLESMQNIRPEFIEEAKPSLKHHGESRNSSTLQQAASSSESSEHVILPEQYRTAGKDITMSKQPMIQRITTGAVAAAACAVFIGGGIFIATQSKRIQTDPALSAATSETVPVTESIPNMFGGQGELVPADPNPLRARTVLRDDTRYYEPPGAWDISGSNDTVIPITDQVPLLQEYELLTDGEHIYTDHHTSIYSIDSYGNETPFLTLETVCNSETQETGTPDPERTYMNAIWHIWSDDTADAYAIAGSTVLEGDAFENSFTFLETAVIDRSTGNVSYQYLPTGTEFDYAVQPVPEKHGFYYHSGRTLYFAYASAENQADNSILQQVFLANPHDLYVVEGSWYVQDDVLYFNSFDDEMNAAYYKHKLTDDGLLVVDPRDTTVDLDTIPQDKLAANEEKTLLEENVHFISYIVRDNTLYTVRSNEENKISRSDLAYENVETIFSLESESESISYLYCTGPHLFFWNSFNAELNLTQIDLSDLSVRNLCSSYDNADTYENTNDADIEDTGMKCNFIGKGTITPSAYNTDGTLVTLRDDTDVYMLEREYGMSVRTPRIAACYHAPISGGTAERYCQIPDCTHSDWDCDEGYIHNHIWLTNGVRVYCCNPATGMFSLLENSEMLTTICIFSEWNAFQGYENINVLEMYPFNGDLILVVGYNTPEEIASEDPQVPLHRKLIHMTYDGNCIDIQDLASDERIAVNGGAGLVYTYTNDHIALKYDMNNSAVLRGADITDSPITALIPEQNRLVYLDTEGRINVLSENGTETIEAPGAENLVQVMTKIYFVRQTADGWGICSLDDENQVAEVLQLEEQVYLYGYAGFYELAFSEGNKYCLFNPSDGTVTEEIAIP